MMRSVATFLLITALIQGSCSQSYQPYEQQDQQLYPAGPEVPTQICRGNRCKEFTCPCKAKKFETKASESPGLKRYGYTIDSKIPVQKPCGGNDCNVDIRLCCAKTPACGHASIIDYNSLCCKGPSQPPPYYGASPGSSAPNLYNQGGPSYQPQRPAYAPPGSSPSNSQNLYPSNGQTYPGSPSYSPGIGPFNSQNYPSPPAPGIQPYISTGNPSYASSSYKQPPKTPPQPAHVPYPDGYGVTYHPSAPSTLYSVSNRQPILSKTSGYDAGPKGAENYAGPGAYSTPDQGNSYQNQAPAHPGSYSQQGQGQPAYVPYRPPVQNNPSGGAYGPQYISAQQYPAAAPPPVIITYSANAASPVGHPYAAQVKPSPCGCNKDRQNVQYAANNNLYPTQSAPSCPYNQNNQAPGKSFSNSQPAPAQYSNSGSCSYNQAASVPYSRPKSGPYARRPPGATTNYLPPANYSPVNTNENAYGQRVSDVPPRTGYYKRKADDEDELDTSIESYKDMTIEEKLMALKKLLKSKFNP